MKVISSINNQYSLGAPSACTLLSCEAVQQILLGNPFNLQTLKKLENVAKRYTRTSHQSVDDALQLDDGIVVEQRNQLLSRKNFSEIVKTYKEERGFIITAPPETVGLIWNGIDSWILFDSHKRELHKGMGFIIFSNDKDVVAYLEKIFPIVDLGDDDVQAFYFQNIEFTSLRKKM